MNLFNYLMAKKGHNTSVRDDLFSYLLGKRTPKEIKTATGTTISISDATKEKIVSLTLLKESTQDGTPTPENPVEVKAVKGYRNLLEITETNFLRNCRYVSGANTDEYKVLCSATDMYINEITYTGSSYDATRNGNLIPCNYGETLYFDTGNVLFNKNFFIEFDENMISLGFYNKQARRGTYTPTNANCKYVSFRFGYGSGSVAGTTYTLAPIIVKGSTSLPYVPYGTNWIYTMISDGTNSRITTIPLGNNEICGIGIYKDELVIDKKGHCWLDKKVGKVILDGSNEETWVYESTVKRIYTGITQSIRTNYNNANFFCNRFQPVVSNFSSGKVVQYGKTYYFYIENIASSVVDFRTWLSTNNIELYFPLETPQLIDLEYDIDISLFIGNNTITNSAEANMQLEYY